MTAEQLHSLLGREQCRLAISAAKRYLTGALTFTRDEVRLISLLEAHHVSYSELERLAK